MSDQPLEPIEPTAPASGAVLNYAPPRQRKTIDGTIRVFIAESLILPTGLITAIFLTNSLGKHYYGQFTLVVTLITWIEWSITSIFTRAAIKFISEAKEDWKSVGTVVIWAHLALSLLAMAILMLLAGPIAALMDVPSMEQHIRLFSLDLPIFALAQAHRQILVGKGDFRRRAWTSVGRWTSRMVLMILLVQLGYGVQGAILGALGASAVELIVARLGARAPLLRRPGHFPIARLFGYAVPLFLSAMALRLYEKLDVFLLLPLSGNPDRGEGDVGVYAAAQNFALLPGIFAASFSPLLLSTLVRTLQNGSVKRSKEMARDAMRGSVLMFLGAAVFAGAGPEFVRLVFKPEFAESGVLLAVLIIGATAVVLVSVASSILVAAEKPQWTVALCAPMVVLAAIGHWYAIPAYHGRGAAAVTTLVAVLAALASILAVQRVWKIHPPLGTIVRTMLVSAVVGWLTYEWSTPGVWVLLKMPLMLLLALVAMLLLGEFTQKERHAAMQFLRLRKATN